MAALPMHPCRKIGIPCSKHIDCFCNDSRKLRCVYDHEEKDRICIPDDENLSFHSTTPQHTSATTNTPPSNTPGKDVTTQKTTNAIWTKERPGSILKFGTNSPDEEPKIEKITHTKTLPSTRDITARKEDRIDVPAQSLCKVLNELYTKFIKWGY